MAFLQALTITIALFFVVQAAPGQAGPQTRPGIGDSTQTAEKLVGECDRLLRQAVQRPYGWAWPTIVDDGAAAGPAKPAVGFTAGFTPSAGLVLHWAGRELKRPAYSQGAHQAARGIMAVQDAAGRVPTSALFANRIINEDVVSVLPDRSATCASLGLLLAMLDEGHGDDETIRRGGARAARWLMRQQTPSGVWPVTISQQTDEDEQPRQARIVRLDDSGYRDCTLALLYASQVLPDRIMQSSAQRATGALARLSLSQSHTARGLWQAAYELDGTPSVKIPLVMEQIEMLACRHSMTTLATVGVICDDGPALANLQTAAKTIVTLRYDDGLWLNRYPLLHNELPAIGKGPAPRAKEAVFASSTPERSPPTPPGVFGLPGVLRMAERLKAGDPATIRKELETNYSIKQAMGRTLAGLTDEPICVDLPADAPSAKAYLAQHGELTDLSNLPAGNDSPTVIRRAARLLVLLRLQRLAEGDMASGK